MNDKVVVYDGTGEVLLGEGELIGYVTVYGWFDEQGRLLSLNDAETKPEGAKLADFDDILDGQVTGVMEIVHNPKIRLDDGRIVYGCQVWWKYK